LAGAASATAAAVTLEATAFVAREETAIVIAAAGSVAVLGVTSGLAAVDAASARARLREAHASVCDRPSLARPAAAIVIRTGTRAAGRPSGGHRL